jgi:hypothetical protein
VHAFLHVTLIVAAYSVFPIFAWVFAVWLPPRSRSDDEDDPRPAPA